MRTFSAKVKRNDLYKPKWRLLFFFIPPSQVQRIVCVSTDASPIVPSFRDSDLCVYLSTHFGLALLFLTNVYTFVVAFFDSPPPRPR